MRCVFYHDYCYWLLLTQFPLKPTIIELINMTFVQAGLIETIHGPLKLRCTLRNTIYHVRKPCAQNGRRVPLGFKAMLAADVFRRLIPNSLLSE